MAEITFLTNKDKAALEAKIASKVDKAAMAYAAKIEVGTYVGTGMDYKHWGDQGKSSLTFNFVPKLVFIKDAFSEAWFINGEPQTQVQFYDNTYNTVQEAIQFCPNTVEWDNDAKTMTWYSSVAELATHQLNNLYSIYTYVAIG